MTEEPRDYDLEFTAAVTHRIRRRLGFDSERGDVRRFVLQLEYYHDDEWHTVVRYDHDGTGESEFSHDVPEEGLHIDIYRDGEKEATEYVTGPQPAALALDRAEDHLSENLQRFITRYEKWHEINNR
ncbi:MAG: hypothetical protein ABEI98_00325 [Halorhabdus sp.]